MGFRKWKNKTLCYIFSASFNQTDWPRRTKLGYIFTSIFFCNMGFTQPTCTSSKQVKYGNTKTMYEIFCSLQVRHQSDVIDVVLVSLLLFLKMC